ncbi:nucleic acid dioxygenase ALKBH1-like [Ornithodoros turicata]|uniref:nucleic acid dioxygenase ALKBH1-like n=1 Tax=Ornithodoros turicata TaxID=34597 RepID=UPI003138EB99
MDAFKKEFKYYKSRRNVPDLSHVIDFSRPNEFPQLVHRSTLATSATSEQFGITPHVEIPCYEVSSNPGLTVIPNPFTVRGQQMWIQKCLQLYPTIESATNVHDDVPRPGPHGKDFSMDFYQKLRWVTLGYHHNWDTKVYDTKNASPFPQCLRALISHLAELVGYRNYLPQAAIVNYYHMDSTLSGHVDSSEFAQTLPLFSISFGQNAVFLIGASTKEVKPTAIYLRSGDVVVMAGESRLAYHGVPLVLPADGEGIWRYSTEEESWKPFEDYVSKNRININVRQVFDIR